jgi:hypothetical protein
MNRRKQNLLLFAALLGVAVIGTEIWLLQRARVEAGRAQASLEQKKQERDWVGRQSPAPTVATEAALHAEWVAVRDRLAELRDGLQARPTDAFAGPVPEKPTEAFFQLAALVEQARAQAIATRVTLRPDERFGFATYANEGPSADLLGAVHRQQKAVQSLLEPLFEARPLALLGVRRISPAVGTVGARGGADDFFTLDPGLSLREPGLVDTEPVRLEFTGQTSTLRTFLNGLSALRQPVVVRSVEVEPLAPAGVSRPVAADAPQPLVRQSLSKFAVTVEFILLSPVPATPAP